MSGIRTSQRQALAKRIKTQLHLGQSQRLADGTDIRIEEFDMAKVSMFSKDEVNTQLVRDAVQEISRTANREGLLIKGDGGGAMILVLQSESDDDFLVKTFKTLSLAAKSQLSGSKPGLLMAGFSGIEAEQLHTVAAQDDDAYQRPTPLRVRVSKFLEADTRDHVVGVAFLSRSTLLARSDEIVSTGGATYYFPKKTSSHWKDEFGQLFA